MKSKCGLGVLLLAGLLSAIAIWFLPVNSAAADILLLITGGAVTRTTTQTEVSEIQTYGMLSTLKNVSLEETNTPKGSDFVTDFEENNFTFSVPSTYYPETLENDIFTTQSPNSLWNTTDTTAGAQNNTGDIAGTELHDHTHFYPSLYSVDKQSVTPDMTTNVTDMNKTHCSSGPTSADVLAIAIGVVFATIILGSLLYQFAVFMRKKKKTSHSDGSVYVIENEFIKYDVEANGLEPDTRL